MADSVQWLGQSDYSICISILVEFYYLVYGDNYNGRETKENTYLLPSEFERRTVRYGPSFFPFDLWPKREARGHKSRGKTRGSVTYGANRENEVSKIFTISLRVSEGLRNDFYSRGRASNF